MMIELVEKYTKNTRKVVSLISIIWEREIKTKSLDKNNQKIEVIIVKVPVRRKFYLQGDEFHLNSMLDHNLFKEIFGLITKGNYIFDDKIYYEKQLEENSVIGTLRLSYMPLE